jgi:hypothetical protein
MYPPRHYLVRLRWSKRPQYLLARWLLLIAVIVVLLSLVGPEQRSLRGHLP